LFASDQFVDRDRQPDRHVVRVKALRGSIAKKLLPILCVPKRNPIVLASFMIEPHYIDTLHNENDKNDEAIHRIEKNQGV
jgi:hypothetical protein